MQHRRHAHRAWPVVVLAVLVVVPALLPGSATAQDTGAAPGIDPALLADASWHGRPIQRPIPHTTPVADRSPGLTPGTGYHTPTGSRRVRDLQRRLLRLGYRPGTRDGLYGPRTQAAVTAFQRKHGLQQDGSAGPETLTLLRRRTTPKPTPQDPTLTPQSQSQARAPTPAPAPLAPTAATDDDNLLTETIAISIAVAGLALLVLATRRRRRAPEQPQAPAPLPTPVIQPPATHEQPRIYRVAPHPEYLGSPWERRAALRERILAMKADGMTLQDIADRLTAEGVPTLGGARRWQPWSVHAATRPTTPTRHPAQHSRRR